MTDKLTPAEVCEALIGPPSVLAETVNLHAKAPFHWRRAAKFRDAGDIPSARLMRALLAHSAARGLGLTAEHLIWGASTSEVEAILARRGSVPEAAE